MAAGLSIAPDKIDLFRQRLNELARRALKPEDLQPPLRWMRKWPGRNHFGFAGELDQFETDRAGESGGAILRAQSHAEKTACSAWARTSSTSSCG
jgi:hypothetical protein